MKNFTSVLIGSVLCLCTSAISAQQHAGLKAGINYSGLSGYDGGKTVNPHAGFFTQWSLSGKWQLRPELLWSAGKQQYTVDENESIATQTLNMQFASVPVVFRYMFNSRCFAEAGPQLSVLVSAKDISTSGAKADVKRSLRSTDFSLVAGAGFSPAKRLEVYLRYNYGFTDLTLYDGNRDCNRGLQAGVAFSLK